MTLPSPILIAAAIGLFATGVSLGWYWAKRLVRSGPFYCGQCRTASYLMTSREQSKAVVITCPECRGIAHHYSRCSKMAVGA